MKSSINFGASFESTHSNQTLIPVSGRPRPSTGLAPTAITGGRHPVTTLSPELTSCLNAKQLGLIVNLNLRFRVVTEVTLRASVD